MMKFKLDSLILIKQVLSTHLHDTELYKPAYYSATINMIQRKMDEFHLVNGFSESIRLKPQKGIYIGGKELKMLLGSIEAVQDRKMRFQMEQEQLERELKDFTQYASCMINWKLIPDQYNAVVFSDGKMTAVYVTRKGTESNVTLQLEEGKHYRNLFIRSAGTVYRDEVEFEKTTNKEMFS